MNIFGFIGFMIPLVGIYIWNHQIVYDHWLIQSFSIRNRFDKSKINQVITDLNYKYYTNVNCLELNQESQDSEFTKTKYETSVNQSSDSKVKVLFSVIVSLSIELIVLILCELIEVSTSTSTIFHLIIDTLVIMVTIFLPLLILSLITTGKLFVTRPKTVEIVEIIGIFTIWLLILSRCGIYTDTITGSSSKTRKSFVDQKISEISIMGITTISILSGIGSSSTIYNLVTKFNKNVNNEIRESDLNKIIQSYNGTNMLINKRQTALNDMMIKSGGTIYNLPNDSNDGMYLNDLSRSGKNRIGGILHKVQSFAGLSSINTEDVELTQEIKSLKSLNESIYGDINKKLALFIHQKASPTTNFDKLLKAFEYGFSIYCIYRIFNVFLIKLPFYYFYSDSSVVTNETLEASSDALAITISKLMISLLNWDIPEAQLINQISFILSGGLFLCSFSNVLMTFKSFGRIVPSIFPELSPIVKNWLKHLVIAQLLAIYVISTCLLIRTNLPTNLSNQISRILSLSGNSSSDVNSSREVEFVDHWFDLGYALSCILTFIVFLIRSYSEEVYDEESFIEDKGYKFL